MPIKFDFWNTESTMRNLIALYGVDRQTIIDASEDDDPVVYFLKNTGINPDTYKLDGVQIRCQLIGKYIDGLEGIKSKGIVSLLRLLDEDSPLKVFLAEKGIEIRIAEKRLIYKGKIYNLHESEKCDVCQLGYEICPHRYPSVSCNYYEDVGKLSAKLYHDHGEIEAFYAAEKREMITYSRVAHHPEILDTIDEMINNLTGDNLCLGRDWERRSEGFDSLSFFVSLSDTTYITGCDKEWQSIMDYEDYLENEYEMVDEYPELLYLNIWLIGTALNIVAGYRYTDWCLGIKSDVTIPPEDIIITHNDIKGYQ